MSSWKTIAAWVCFLLAAVSATFGILLAGGLIHEYGNTLGMSANLAFQAGLLAAPGVVVFGTVGYLLHRSARRLKS